MATMNCLFCKIIHNQIPVHRVFEDENFLAFHDISPQAPCHVLVIPKKHIQSINEITAADDLLLGQLLLTAKHIAATEGLKENGYRLVFNTNTHGGQTVDHIHLHILGGRQMMWPPG